MTVPVAVLASGSGTNLQALLDREGAGAGRDSDPPGSADPGGPADPTDAKAVESVPRGSAPYEIRLVISDRPDAGALERARLAGRRAEVVPVSERSLDAVGEDTLDLFDAEAIEAVFLAGYLRLVPPAVVEAYRRRILNVHPALLPAFGGEGMYGIRVHRAVLASGARVSGVTIHFVDEHYDTGTIFAQWPVPVRSGDTPETLAMRVLRVEHLLYPAAAAHLCQALSKDEEPGAFDPPGDLFSVEAAGSSVDSAPRLGAVIDASFRASFRESG